MPATFTINPQLTSVGQGLFNTAAVGLVQGTAYPDPATRFALRTGILDPAETLPMWGGVGVYENIPGANPNTGPVGALGPIIGRATAMAGAKPLLGFSVFDQAYGMINSPQSPVPLAGSFMQVMTYRMGSGARIAVACDPGLVSLQGLPLNSQVNWDFVDQILVPYTGTVAVSSGTYNTTTGEVVLTMASAVNLSPGDDVIISGTTGTGSFASVNGNHVATAGTAGSSVHFIIATGLTMTITGGSLTTGGTALPVSVLDVQPAGCMTVNYNVATGFATWNYNGACAVIQI
jgi:hypothetical protein